MKWLNHIEGASVDLLITDPPYLTEFKDGFADFVAKWTKAAWRTLKPTSQAYVFIGAYPAEIAAYLAAIEVQDILVWTYRNTIGPTPKTSYVRNWQAILYWRGPKAPPINSTSINELLAVQDFAAPDGRHGNRFYKWQKPIALCERLITHGSQPGEIVVDPFCGSGMTLLAAAKLGRIASGCDNDKDAIGIAKDGGCVSE